MGLPFTIVEGAIVVTDTTGKIVDIITDVLGTNRFAVDATANIENLRGLDDQADTWFAIGTFEDCNDANINIGDSIRIQIVAGCDPSLQPAVDVTVVVTATESGSERKFRDLIINTLNNNTNFKASLFAQKIKSNGSVHIFSKFIADRGERPVAGDVTITGTGIAVELNPILGDRLITRNKNVLGTADSSDPRYSGLRIAGAVTSTLGAAGDIYLNQVVDVTTSPEMGVSGGSLISPRVFSMPISTTKDIFVTEIRLFSADNGVKMENFMALNSPLTNGILLEIKADDEPRQWLPLKSTADIKNKFALGSGANFRFDVGSGEDHILGVLTFARPLPIRAAGTFATNDYVRFLIRDNLNSVNMLQALVVGTQEDPF